MPQSHQDSAQNRKPLRFICRSLVLVFSIVVSSAYLSAADLQSGKNAYAQKDYGLAMSELLPLAQAGNVDAQVLVGKMYMLGLGTSKNTELALRWFQSASDQGNAEAEFVLGAMYLLPQRDVPLGLKWLRRSADQGTADAQLLVGMAYLKGGDLPRDLVQADMWLRLAAAQGDKFAASQCERAEREMTTNQIEKARSLAAAWKPSSIQMEVVQRPTARQEP